MAPFFYSVLNVNLMDKSSYLVHVRFIDSVFHGNEDPFSLYRFFDVALFGVVFIVAK